MGLETLFWNPKGRSTSKIEHALGDTHMNIMLLSGGSGKRLWPLSNEVRSKQFLKLFTNSHGAHESMFQRVYRQIAEASLDANVVVAAGRSQLGLVRRQVGDEVDVVLEPARRDTFPAIALSCAYLAYEKNRGMDEVVIVLPVDSYTERDYFTSLLKLEQSIIDGTANIALMGINPTHPSPKYGYIVPSKFGDGIERFQEKPSLEQAAQLIEDGAMWNAGVFAFKLGYLMNMMSKYIDFSSCEDVERQYALLPKISFDYEVAEKEQSMAVIKYGGLWKDVGTWDSLTEVIDGNSLGNVILANSCNNTHVINELDIPVVVVGASDMVVVAGPEGILISSKEESSQIKRYVEKID